MFSGFGLPELIVVLLIVLLLFGPKRLKTLGSDLGSAIKGFRTSVADEEKKTADATAEKVIEGQVNAESTQTEAKQNSNV
ncbi:MAG: twin-arginine translocase TatA/TatE family subunit [Pseudomonadota bacterium]